MMFGNITEGLYDTIMTVRKNTRGFTNEYRGFLVPSEGQSNHYPSNINASVFNTLYRIMSHAKKTSKKTKQNTRLCQNMQ